MNFPLECEECNFRLCEGCGRCTVESCVTCEADIPGDFAMCKRKGKCKRKQKGPKFSKRKKLSDTEFEELSDKIFDALFYNKSN